MTLQTMMFNGTSGVSSMANYMAVLADNVANVNSVAYKASRAVFQDAITSAMGEVGEVGNGARMGSVTKPFQVGQFEGSERATDMAIAGRGFFMLRDPLATTAEVYSRDGQFRLTGAPGADADTAYNLISAQGYFVQGYNLTSTATPSTAAEDILIRRESLPKATENVTVAVNLQSTMPPEDTDAPLYAAWDGAAAAGPLAESDYSFSTTLTAYDDTGAQFDLTVYFDQTTNANEQEFLVTCDPALDRRLIGATSTRYNDGAVAEKGAGALLYGKLTFGISGDLAGIDCWEVPADTLLTPTDANKIVLARGEADYSFAYNVSGTGANLLSTLNFGTEAVPQSITSPGPALATAAGATAPSATPLTGWDSVYDTAGNQVQDGDTITFTGTDGDGNPVTLAYVVDQNNDIGDLLAQLESQFQCDATIVDGQLRLADLVVGDSQLAITGITYRDAAGLDPAANPSLAQCFGIEGSGFIVDAGDRYNLAAIGTTSYATPSATLYQQQDGFATGHLENLAVDKHGIISALYSNGQREEQAQLVLSDFANFEGMAMLGGNLFAATERAGAQTTGFAGEGPLGSVQGNTLEMSNVDLGQQFAELIVTQRGFQANSVSISTANELYQTVLRLK